MIGHHSDRSRSGPNHRAVLEAGPAALICAVLVIASVPFVGATARGGIQSSATSVRPPPERASRDRAAPYFDGCLVSKSATRSPPCVYGDARSRTTVALFGDSHALQFFPAVERVAIQRDWRLLVLTKSACPAAYVTTYRRRGRPWHECDAWRRSTLRRIDREKPTLIVISNDNRTAVRRGRVQLHGLSRLRALARGYAAMVERLLAGGARVGAILDTPRAPFDVPRCVVNHMQDLRRCAFPKPPAHGEGATVEAVLRRIRGLRTINPVGQLCVASRCPAVIDDILVYRNQGHLTATFAATLASWLGKELRDLP